MDKSYLNLGVRGRLFDLILPISRGKQSGKGAGECLEEDFLSPKARGSLTVHFREKKRGPVSTTPYKVWALNG